MLGKFRGKVGATVFRTEAGIGQIASEYNPNPKNPRTIAQTRQRAKMNLAGLFSKLTPYVAIAGLNSNGRMARSEFVSHLLKVATLSGTGTTADPIKASVASGDIMFSKGESGNVGATNPYVGTGKVYVNLTVDQQQNNVLQMVGIVVASKNGVTVEVATGVHTIEVNGREETLPIPVSTPFDMADTTFDVYVFPILKKDGATSVAFDENIDFATSTYSVSVARTLSSIGAYGASRYIGAAILGE